MQEPNNAFMNYFQVIFSSMDVRSKTFMSSELLVDSFSLGGRP